jgi:pimeloyl-ACP methyl ester carboxylesterase
MKLNYKKLGEGRPLIILHGLFGSLDNWMTLAKQWSENFEVWLLDQRNHGQSERSEEFSYQVMAEDLKDFIQEQSIEEPIILGHSMGGKTAMEYAVNYPTGIHKLVVVDIAPVSYQVHHYQIIEGLESVDLSAIKSRTEADEKLRERIAEPGVRQFLLKNLYWKEKGRLDWRFNLPVIKREILPISEWAISDKNYDGPTLFVKGNKSNYILPEYGAAMAKKFPNYDLEVIENAGHWVHAEQQKLFFEKVSSFMKD